MPAGGARSQPQLTALSVEPKNNLLLSRQRSAVGVTPPATFRRVALSRFMARLSHQARGSASPSPHPLTHDVTSRSDKMPFWMMSDVKGR